SCRALSKTHGAGEDHLADSTPIFAPDEALYLDNISFTYHQHLGKSVDVPLNIRTAGLSDPRKSLLEMAADKLLVYKPNNQYQLTLRDAYVALSCTVDLHIEGTGSYFSPEYLSAAEDAFSLQVNNAERLKITMSLLNIMEEKTNNDGVRELRKKIKLKADYEEGPCNDQMYRNILCVLEHMYVTFISPSMAKLAITFPKINLNE
ncbi:hypothetical protein BGZ65_009258, partial [Modicella reniformis]